MARRRNPYRHDPNTRRAASLGYPARSVFKLEEIDRRLSLLRPGHVVLDLGAAPGSWSRYAARRVQPGGRVVAVDLRPLVEPVAPNVTVVIGDVLADPNPLVSHLRDSLQKSEASSRAKPPTSEAKAPYLSRETGCHFCVLSWRQDTTTARH